MMENRHLYRGKRIDNGEWVIGNRIDSPDGRVAITETGGGWELYECGIATICQCVGRIDRDKTLIFEHDVVAYLDTYSTESGYAEIACVGEVAWDEETLSFQVTNRSSAESWEVLDGECKVLGNTIDNPELVEV